MDFENNINNEKNYVNKITNFFIRVTFCYYILIMFYFFIDYDYIPHLHSYYNNFCNNFCNNDFCIKFINFITKFEKKMSKKLLIYNGIYDDFISDSDSDSSSPDSSCPDSSSPDSSSPDSSSPDSSSSDSKPEIKYEDKYLDDVKKMSIEYVFSSQELQLINDKFNEFFNVHKINIVNEKHNLNQLILEKSIKYISIDDEDSESDSNSNESDSKDSNSNDKDSNDSNSNDNKDDDIINEYYDIQKNEFNKEEKKKAIELEIIDLRAKLKEIENMSDDLLLITNAKLEARNFVIKERLDGLKNNFIFEKTPLGNVIMYYNNSRESFEYYTDNTIPYRFLETVSRKYVKTFNCKQIYIDMEFELKEFERKQKEAHDLKLLEDSLKEKIEIVLEKKKDVFTKFKSYNTESGTGKVNRGAAPPKNSIPNNTMKKKEDKLVLKDYVNRYTCEGKLANFSFLKKISRKIVDKKYAMSFADFKKMKK